MPGVDFAMCLWYFAIWSSQYRDLKLQFRDSRRGEIAKLKLANCEIDTVRSRTGDQDRKLEVHSRENHEFFANLIAKQCPIQFAAEVECKFVTTKISPQVLRVDRPIQNRKSRTSNFFMTKLKRAHDGKYNHKTKCDLAGQKLRKKYGIEACDSDAPAAIFHGDSADWRRGSAHLDVRTGFCADELSRSRAVDRTESHK